MRKQIYQGSEIKSNLSPTLSPMSHERKSKFNRNYSCTQEYGPRSAKRTRSKCGCDVERVRPCTSQLHFKIKNFKKNIDAFLNLFRHFIILYLLLQIPLVSRAVHGFNKFACSQLAVRTQTCARFIFRFVAPNFTCCYIYVLSTYLTCA